LTGPLLNAEDVEAWLKNNRAIDDNRARKIVQLADGSPNMALKLLENEEDNNTQRFTEWMRACFKKSYGALVTMADDYHGLDKLSQRNLMAYSMNMMRETLLFTSGAGTINRARGEELKFIQDFSKVMNVEKVERSFTLLNDASYHLERNGSAKMIFLDLSLKLAKTLNP
ncbi:DNA polymerase III subunit delta, partial [Fulvivirgaceae bacterium PWU4]|nr:DNA polymerase III subunit delta [Chryseosolibacter histidini]